MGAPVTYCTIISKNYLAHARTLAVSLKTHHPDAPFFVLLVDEIAGYFDPEQEPFNLVELKELEIPELEAFCFQYDLLELNTAAKPFFLQILFKRGHSKIIYLDPDILIIRPLTKLGELLDHYSLLLTPHTTEPLPLHSSPSELDLLRSGTFNLGFFALRQSEASTRCLTWWKERLYRGCQVNLEGGMHVDQRWMDLVPSLFEDHFVIRDTGYNVAYWNLDQRQLTHDQNGWWVNGEPGYFFHFSGFDPLLPHRVSRYFGNRQTKQYHALGKLFSRYRDELFQHHYSVVRKWPYAFGSFNNGEEIPGSLRREFLDMEVRKRFGNPFETEPASSLYRWWKRLPPTTSLSLDTAYSQKLYWLQKKYDLTAVEITSHRRVLTRPFTSAKKLLARMLWPVLYEQTCFNELVNQEMEALHRTVRKLQRQLQE